MVWESCKLGELFEIKHGFAFKGEFFSDAGEKILLTPGNFHESGGLKLKGDKEKYYLGDFPEDYLLKKGDMLVAMTDLTQNAPILGSPLIVPESEVYLHNQRLGKIINLANERISKDFLYHLLNTRNVREQIKGSATGATVRHTAPSRIYDVQVDLPSLAEQQEIAQVLSAYNDLIENNTRRIAILETIAQNLYREWFINFRFPNHAQTQWQDTPQGKIPLGWEIRLVKDFGEVVTGKTPSKNKPENYDNPDIQFIKTPDMHGGIYVIETTEMLSKAGADSQKNKYLPAGSIMVSCIGTAGIVAMNIEPAQTNQQINAVVVGNDFEREFLYFSLLDLKQTIINHGSTGATMTNLSKGKFEVLEVVAPKEDLLQKFSGVVQPIFQQILCLMKKNKNLKQQRDMLLPKLISNPSAVSNL